MAEGAYIVRATCQLFSIHTASTPPQQPLGDDVHRILLWWFTTPKRENPILQQYQKRQPSEEGSKIGCYMRIGTFWQSLGWLLVQYWQGGSSLLHHPLATAGNNCQRLAYTQEN
jgi:hypothetical protein